MIEVLPKSNHNDIIFYTTILVEFYNYFSGILIDSKTGWYYLIAKNVLKLGEVVCLQ